jgi:FMN phosphatase YigB (HAD superfamily)
MPDGSVIERVRDSASGEVIEITYPMCGHCGQVVYDLRTGYHKQCVREFKEREAMRLQKEREEYQREQDLAMFGEVLNSQHERLIRTYPDRLIEGERETYNQRLAREKQEHIQDLYTKLSQIDQRRRRVPELHQEIKHLERQIGADVEIEKTLKDELSKLAG